MTTSARTRLVSLSFVVLLSATVYADDCSGFSDCYNTLRGALAALVAMAVFAIVLFALIEAFPILGWALMVHGAIGGLSGKDPITGRQLEAWERVLGLLPVAGLAFKEAGLLRSVAAAFGELAVDTRGAALLPELAEEGGAARAAAMGEGESGIGFGRNPVVEPGEPPSLYGEEPRIGFGREPGPGGLGDEPRIGFDRTPGREPGEPPSLYGEEPRIGFGREPGSPPRPPGEPPIVEEEPPTLRDPGSAPTPAEEPPIVEEEPPTLRDPGSAPKPPEEPSPWDEEPPTLPKIPKP